MKDTHRVFNPFCVLFEVSHQALCVAFCLLQKRKEVIKCVTAEIHAVVELFDFYLYRRLFSHQSDQHD